ncbi:MULTISPECIES: glycosyltransferase family A protein [unclassified Providencia]|uniref:glycosyltransferase family A protein n=1 Tax=unclassified Providencia TaxID=2633465 RepID=UPI00234BDF44|nr:MULTISPECIES: glycosyltransferase family A protein [unclassified Providencia]
MRLDMLYSTFGDRVLDLINNIPAPHPKVKIIIVHQNPGVETEKIIKEFLYIRNDVTYFSIASIGVAKSRNFALKKATGDIILFCDDDVIYNKNFQNDIINSHKNNPHDGFITFSYSYIGLNSRPPHFKNYQFKHNIRTILSLGTIQISCKTKYISKFNFKFPEDMGAGTKNFLCDEPVFISNFLKQGIPGSYIPISICMHQVESSGNIFNNIDAYNSRLLCFIRIFGLIKGRALYILFIMKNIRKFNSLKDIYTALKLVSRNTL